MAGSDGGAGLNLGRRFISRTLIRFVIIPGIIEDDPVHLGEHVLGVRRPIGIGLCRALEPGARLFPST